MKQLLKLRYLMVKMRKLDNKMKHQIDRLLSRIKKESLNEKKSTSSLLKIIDGDDNDITQLKEEEKVQSKKKKVKNSENLNAPEVMNLFLNFN